MWDRSGSNSYWEISWLAVLKLPTDAPIVATRLLVDVCRLFREGGCSRRTSSLTMTIMRCAFKHSWISKTSAYPRVRHCFVSPVVSEPISPFSSTSIFPLKSQFIASWSLVYTSGSWSGYTHLFHSQMILSECLLSSPGTRPWCSVSFSTIHFKVSSSLRYFYLSPSTQEL